MIKIYCDGCGEEISNENKLDVRYYTIQVIGISPVGKPLENYTIGHYCPECKPKVESGIKATEFNIKAGIKK